MKTAKVFPNGRSQAVRLPKEFQFSTDEVYVQRIGDVLVLFPRDRAWDVFAGSLERFTEDFMAEREPGGAAEERAAL